MNNNFSYLLLAIFIAVSTFLWIYMFRGTADPLADHIANERIKYKGDITLTMYHGEGCECCMRWAGYLKDHGVTVEKMQLENPNNIKDVYGIAPMLRSCHTAIVDGYVVEGHVPVEDIRRLLSERPDAIGISAPGMPINAPGMDAPVSREYQIILFDEENMSVYSVHH